MYLIENTVTFLTKKLNLALTLIMNKNAFSIWIFFILQTKIYLRFILHLWPKSKGLKLSLLPNLKNQFNIPDQNP